ncbi:hypothetical protein LX90_003656 [Lentzea flava]|nr:hypothetical protein [Lentzea flava]
MSTTKCSLRGPTWRRTFVVLLATLLTLVGRGVAAAEPPTPPPPPSPSGGECGITDIGACVADGINNFFWALVVGALNSLLKLVGETLLATPTLEQLPRVGELWESSRGIAVASYALLVMVAGIVLMAYETLQTRTTIRQVAPRIAVGFLAANLSLLLAGKAIEFANALSTGLLGIGLDPSSTAKTLSVVLTQTVMSSITSAGLFGTLISLGLVVLLISLVGTYVMRVAVTVILLAGAPLFLVCHGLEQTDGIARWWWRAFFGVLGIQVGQSLALIAALRVFFTEGGFTIFGPTPSGLINLIVTGALLWVLVKIPGWVMHHIQIGGGGRTFLGSLIRGFLMYKTFGLLKGATATAAHSGYGHRGGRASGPSDPYANTRTTGNGQYMLPLGGLRKAKAKAKRDVAAEPTTAARREVQLALPFEYGWPENRPVLGRDGQYRLPLNVKRAPRPTGATASSSPRTAARPDRQLELRFDPYKANRPSRAGQYSLPLEGVTKTTPPKPAPPSPAPEDRLAWRSKRQLRLPLDLPKPVRPKPGGARP